MTLPDAFLALSLWVCAGLFVGLIVGRILRASNQPHDHEANPHDC